MAWAWPTCQGVRDHLKWYEKYNKEISEPHRYKIRDMVWVTHWEYWKKW